MSLLTRALARKLSYRYLCTISNSSAKLRPKLKLEKLIDRGLIRVAGKDATPFLQGLVTNDVEHLDRGSQAIYALFLNKGGRILYDSIIYKTQDHNVILVECDVDVVQDLVRHLKIFRVRRKIDVDPISADYMGWVAHGGVANVDASTAIIPTINAIPESEKDVVLCHDPRMKYLGTRIIVPSSYTLGDIEPFFPDNELELAGQEDDYTTLRYKLGVGEGLDDHPLGKALPIESNGDYLHGISFHKGCYLGQELTARTYHTGVIRKRLMPVTLSEEIGEHESEVDIKTSTGASVGKLRGHKNGFGVGLMRIEKVADNVKLLVDNVECSVAKPFWWPGVLPKTRQSVVAEQGSQTSDVRRATAGGESTFPTI